MREWVPCTDLLKGDASEAGATFCTRDSVKVNLRSFFFLGGGIGESERKREGWGWRVGLRLSKEGNNKKKNKSRMVKKEWMREGVELRTSERWRLVSN